MALGTDGTVFVGTQRGNVYAVVDRNRDHKADEVITIASRAHPAERRGVQGRRALRRGDQPGSRGIDGVLDFAQAARRPDARARQPTVVTDKLPTDRAHGWKYLALRPRRPALHADRRAGQHPRPRRSLRDDRPDEARRIELRDLRARRPQLGRPGLASRYARAVVHRQRPRHARRRAAERRAERRAQAGPALRLPVLPRGLDSRPRVRQGQVVRRLHRAGAEAGAARRRARAEVLYGRDVPRGVPEAALHRQPRLVEPHRQPRATPATG